MDKKGQSGIIGIAMLPVIILVLWGSWYGMIRVPQLSEQERELGNVCDEFTKYDGGYDCCEDCKEIELDYFKY